MRLHHKYNEPPKINILKLIWRILHTLSYLTLHHALAVSPDAADGVAGTRRLPGTFSGGAVVVEVPAARVPVGLPVAQNVERRAGGNRRHAGLGDLQLLEVGVDR